MADTDTESAPTTRRKGPQAPSAEQLLKRWDRMVAKRQPAEALWQDIADLVAPGYNFITVTPTEGQKATRKIFDSTATKANSDLATNLAGAMIPTAHEWFSLTFEVEALNQMKAAKEWVEDCTRRMYTAFNTKSNLQRQGKTAFKQLTTFSQLCVFEEEKAPDARGRFQGLRFKSLHAGTYCIEENADGDVDTVFYTFELSARAAYDKWAEACGPKVVACVTQKRDMEQLFEFIHAVYPDPTSATPRWKSCILAKDDKKKVEEKTYTEFPFFVTRWDQRAGMVYGTDGPSEMAFGAYRSLNIAKEIVLKSAPLAMQPPTYERSDAVIGDPDLVPGGRTVVDASGPIGDSFGFLDTHARVDVSQFVFAELRQEILEMYFINQMRLKQSPQMTATEVLELRNQMERLLGPVAGRIEEEFLSPMIKRTWAIMLRAGAFSAPPAELVAYLLEHGLTEADLNVQYEGPLQRVRRSDDALAIVATVNDAIGMATGAEKPDILDSINFDKVLSTLGEIRGTPSDIFYDEKFVKQVRDARAQQQQAAATAATVEQVGKGVGGGQGVKALIEGTQVNAAGLGVAA